MLIPDGLVTHLIVKTNIKEVSDTGIDYVREWRSLSLKRSFHQKRFYLIFSYSCGSNLLKGDE